MFKQRLDIDILKQKCRNQDTLFGRDLDAIRIQLQKSEQSKQDALNQFTLMSEKYNKKQIMDVLDQQSQIKEHGTRLFRTAKYAIQGFSIAQENELPYQTRKVSQQSEKQEDRQYQTFFHEQEPLEQRPFRSEGESAEVTFNHFDESEIQSSEPFQYHLETSKQYTDPVDTNIDDLLNDIEQIVGITSKMQERSLLTHKLQSNTERRTIPLIVDKGPNFKPVNLTNVSLVVPESRVQEGKKDDLDKLILDLLIK